MSISPQTTEHNAQTVSEHGLSFEVLSDPGNLVALKFGFVLKIPDEVRQLYLGSWDVDLAVFNSDNSWTVPMPAQFIIDQGGVIRYAESDADYFQRSEPSRLIEVLKSM